MTFLQQSQQAIRWFLRRLDTHPWTVTVATVGGFTAAGMISWTVLEWIEDRRSSQQQPLVLYSSGGDNHNTKKKPMTLEEARLRAMIENAQSSSWQENLDHAAAAQAQFMLPGRPQATPSFMADIDKRSLEIMKQQHEELKQEKETLQQQQQQQQQERKDTTRIWNS